MDAGNIVLKLKDNVTGAFNALKNVGNA